jgi:type I restriction enzyme R subunit
MTAKHSEGAFEETIERSLLTDGGYTKGSAAAFNRELALFPDEVVAFIQATQPETWSAFAKQHGASLATAVVEQLVKDLAKRGTVDVLRHGFKFYGKKLEAAYFRPAPALNPELEAKYRETASR